MAASNIVSLFRPRQVNRDWNNQELAEFYRVESALISVGFRVDTDRGLSDEGDPWFIFADANSGDVIVHCARVDGAYLIASRAFDSVLRGMDFRSLVETFLASQPVVLPNASTRKQSNVSLHPSALLVALVATAFFKLTSTEVEAADLADGEDSSSAHNGQSETGDGLELDRQQALVVLAAVAVVTGQLRNDFVPDDGWQLLSVVTDGEVSSSSVSRHDNVRVSQDIPGRAADRPAGDAEASVSHSSADAYITRYSAGGAMPDFLIANEFGATETDFDAFKGLSSSGNNDPATASPLKGLSGVHNLHGLDVDGINESGLQGTASRLLTLTSEVTETSSSEAIQDTSFVLEGGNNTVTDTSDQNVGIVLSSSISLPRLKLISGQIANTSNAADTGSSASSDDDGTKVSEVAVVTPDTTAVIKPAPAIIDPIIETGPVTTPEQKQPEPEITFDAKTILKDISPFLNVALHRVKYTDDIHAFDEAAQNFINTVMREESKLATYTNGLDFVIYDRDMPVSPRIDINLVTWALEDGSTISLIGVFDYDHVI